VSEPLYVGDDCVLYRSLDSSAGAGVTCACGDGCPVVLVPYPGDLPWIIGGEGVYRLDDVVLDHGVVVQRGQVIPVMEAMRLARLPGKGLPEVRELRRPVEGLETVEQVDPRGTSLLIKACVAGRLDMADALLRGLGYCQTRTPR
jgi:hypothetical protein